MAKGSNVTEIDDSSTPEVAEAKVAPARAIKGSQHDVELSGKKRTVTIHSSELEGGRDAVNVGLNGFMYQIPRDTPCEVPSEILEILRNAKTTVYTAADGGGATSRDTYRYALTIE